MRVVLLEHKSPPECERCLKERLLRGMNAPYGGFIQPTEEMVDDFVFATSDLPNEEVT